LDEVLADGLPAKNAIRKTQLAQLDLITAGKATAEPAETFDAVAIGRLVAEMKFYYDMIIIDCAPIIPVSDPMLLAPEVDASIIVVRAGQTPKEVVTRAVDIMRSNESARMLGIVLNNVNNHLPHYYNDRYNGYYYAPAEPDKRATRRARETRSDKKNNPGKSKSDESDTLPGSATSADKRISG
jgi:Mrp family chromosome partitioning ATPase